MSGVTETEGEAPEMLAAEYVLGTLDQADAQRARQQAETDTAFAMEIRLWETRLFALTRLVPPVSPPTSLWARIEDTTGAAATQPYRAAGEPGKAANSNAVRWWQAATLAGFALAAGLAVFIGLRPPVPPATFAVLAPTGTTASVLVAVAEPDGSIQVRPSGAIQVASDKDLQLWSLAAGSSTPISLGVLPASGTRLPHEVPPGTQLLVSLEPKGGSTTGQPTGPVVYGGTLLRLE